MKLDFKTLTPLEAEFLGHRLEVPECIAEVLIESDGYMSEEAYAAEAGAVLEAFEQRGTIELTDAACDVIADAVNGSTIQYAWEQMADDDLHPLTNAGLRRRLNAVESLIEKLRALGVDAHRPGELWDEPLKTAKKEN